MDEIPEARFSQHSYSYQSDLKQDAQSQFYRQNVLSQQSVPLAFNQSQQLFQLQENCQQSRPLCMNLIVVSQEEIEAPWRIECQYLTSLIEELERKQGSVVKQEKQIEYVVDNTLIEQLKIQLQKSQNDNFDLQLQLDKQQQDLLTLKSNIKYKDNELESLRLRSQEVREKIVEKVVEKKVYDREKEEYLQSKLNSLQREYETLQTQIYNLESARRNFELENKKIIISLNQKDEELKTLRIQSQQVREKIVEKVVYDREKEEYLQSKLLSLQREYDTLQTQYIQIEQVKRQYELENKRILIQKEEEISQLRIQSQQVREKIVEKVVYNTEKEDLLQSKLLSLQREHESVLNRFKELEFEKRNLEYSNSRILNSITQKEEEMSLLRAQASQIREKVVEKVVYNTEREDLLQSKLNTLQKEYDILSNQFNEMELRKKQTEREYQRVSYNLSQREEELNSLRIQASQVREKIVEKVVYNTEREDYLQQKLLSIQKEYDTLLSRYQELEQFKTNIEFENKKLIFNLNQQEEEVKQLRVQSSQIREKVVEKIVYNTEREEYLESSLYQIQKELDSLAKRYNELEQQKRQIEIENQKFRFNLSQKEEELSTLRIQSSQIREKVVEKVVYNTEREEYLQSSLYQIQKEFDSLAKQYSELEQQKRQIEIENQKFRFNLSQKEEELSTLRIQSSQIREKVVEKVVYNTEREEYLESSLYQIQKELDSLAKRYNELEQQKRQIEIENQKFRFNLSQKEEELSTLRIQSSQIREKIVEKVVYNTEREEYLQSSLYQIQKEFDSLAKQYSELEQQKRQIEIENQKFRFNLTQKEDELSNLRIQSSQVREKVVEKVVYNTEREEYLQSKLFQLQKDYDTLSNQYNESLKENFTIKQELDRKEQEINSTQMKFVQIQDSNQKTWDLERQINYLQDELEKTRNQLIQIRSENQDLNMKISDLETHYYQNQTTLTEQEQKIYYLQGQLKQSNSDTYFKFYGTTVMEEKLNYLSQEVEIWKHKFIRANHLYNEALEDNGILRAEIETQKSAKKPFIIQSSSYQKTSQFNPLEENNNYQ